jgi:hypothetical protein
MACPAPLRRFVEVFDGRRDRCLVHPVAVVLALCAAAVVAGMLSLTATVGWVADVPEELLTELYGREMPLSWPLESGLFMRGRDE